MIRAPSTLTFEVVTCKDTSRAPPAVEQRTHLKVGRPAPRAFRPVAQHGQWPNPLLTWRDLAERQQRTPLRPSRNAPWVLAGAIPRRTPRRSKPEESATPLGRTHFAVG